MSAPCPTCHKPIGDRLRRRLTPYIPDAFGPFRRAALAEAQEGWCAACDRPLPARKFGQKNKYTCGRKECRKWWTNLCARDWHHKKQAAEALAEET